MKQAIERGMHKVILVTRTTRLEELEKKYNTLEQARFYMEHLGADFSDYILEDRNYREAVNQAVSIAERFARVQVVEKTFLPNLIFGRDDIIVTVGQDGLVANVMKYLMGHPLIGINPDIRRWDGVLLPFEPGDLERILPAVIGKNYNQKSVTMARAVSQDGQEMLAVNDLFVGQRTHTSAQYDIFWNKRQEAQSSSGIIISTGLGATGWYKSILAEARGIAGAFGLNQAIHFEPADWSADRLTFVVREPYPSRATQTELVYGNLKKRDTFRIVSKMAVNGVVFSDGMENDAMEFNAGNRIEIGIADQKGNLVV